MKAVMDTSRTRLVTMLAAIQILARCGGESIPFTNCAGDDAPLKFTEVFVDPYPVQPGKVLNITQVAVGDRTYDDLIADISNYIIKRGKNHEFVHFHKSLCHGSGKQTNCPINPGQVVFEDSHGKIPIIAPKGKYFARGLFITTKNETVGCAEFYYDTK